MFALKTDIPLNKEQLYSIWHMKITDQKDIKQRKNDALKTDMPLNKEKLYSKWHMKISDQKYKSISRVNDKPIVKDQ